MLPGSPGAEYLASRGLAGAIRTYGLGFVDEPLPGHEMYEGMLAIPYIRYPNPRKAGIIVAIRFRCIEDHEHNGHGKYNTQPGDRPRLYNARALQTAQESIALCEGEFDAISAELAGVPAVAVPGVQAWRPHFRAPFLGYETVWILTDGDEPGRQFGNTIAQTLNNAKIIPSPDGMDVNSYINEYGPEALKERLA